MGIASQFTVQTESRNGVARLVLAGELDLVGVPVLEEHLARVEQNGVTGIMLDLHQVTFVDSSGLKAFLQASERAKTNGHRIVLVGASPVCQRLFTLTRTEFLLDAYEGASVVGQFIGRGRPLGPMEFAVTDGDV